MVSSGIGSKDSDQRRQRGSPLRKQVGGSRLQAEIGNAAVFLPRGEGRQFGGAWRRLHVHGWLYEFEVDS